MNPLSARARIALLALSCAGCASAHRPGNFVPGGDDTEADMAARDAAPRDASTVDGAGPRDLAASIADLAAPAPDLSRAADLAAPLDLAPPPDLAPRPDLATPGLITGGPCASGAPGATAFRVRFVDGGGRATVNYDVNGLPDKTRWKVGAYGYNIGFSPMFVDPFLGAGGLQLDGSDFVDIELSTKGVNQIRSATLALYGRSYSVGTSGSFSWMTFTGAGATPANSVSNVAPYQWYGASVAGAIPAGDGGILLRLKAGPNSNSLVVNRIELCLEAS